MRMPKTISLELRMEVAITIVHGIAPYFRFHLYVYALVGGHRYVGK